VIFIFRFRPILGFGERIREMREKKKKKRRRRRRKKKKKRRRRRRKKKKTKKKKTKKRIEGDEGERRRKCQRQRPLEVDARRSISSFAIERLFVLLLCALFEVKPLQSLIECLRLLLVCAESPKMLKKYPKVGRKGNWSGQESERRRSEVERDGRQDRHRRFSPLRGS